MSTALEASLRAHLEALHAALRTDVGARREGSPREIDEGAQAAGALEDEVRVAVLNRRSEQAAQIEGALRSLALGEYGWCRDCQEFIGRARLQAVPFAQRCAPCQARVERGAAA
jgi:DnaK suppressor protein